MDKEASGFNTKQTVAIVGLGLIGGSYARGLRRIGVGHIIAIDPCLLYTSPSPRD